MNKYLRFSIELSERLNIERQQEPDFCAPIPMTRDDWMDLASIG